MALSHSSNSIKIFAVAILVVYKRGQTSTGSNFLPDVDGRLSRTSVYEGSHLERLSCMLVRASLNKRVYHCLWKNILNIFLSNLLNNLCTYVRKSHTEAVEENLL